MTKTFGSLTVLDKVSLRVYPGEVIVVIGPSGSGKSTLCRTLNQLEPIDSGELTVCGMRLPLEGRALTAFRSSVGMVFQSFALFPHMTVLDNVTKAPMAVKKISKENARERAMALLTRVGVADQAHKMPAMLSGGQQQRAAIARALAMDPRLMLFDEPTSALDPEMIAEVLDVIRSVANEGMSMVIVTHEMNFGRNIADRIVFMDEGRIVEDSDPESFFRNPKSDRATDFLAKLKY